MPFEIHFSKLARVNFGELRKYDQNIIAQTIFEQLVHQPDQITRHRKQLEPNPFAEWELRIGDYRVFYRIRTEEETVVIVAIGRKIHNQVFVSGKELLL